MGPDRSDETDTEASYATAFRDHFDAVLRYALHRADADTARDAVAQTFAVAWRRRRDMPDTALPWLVAITRRTLAEHRRAAGRRRGLGTKLQNGRAVHATPDLAEGVAERMTVLEALRGLSPADQEVLMLIAWDGLDPDDAASALGCSRNALAVRLSRARARLASALTFADDNSDPMHQPMEAR